MKKWRYLVFCPTPLVFWIIGLLMVTPMIGVLVGARLASRTPFIFSDLMIILVNLGALYFFQRQWKKKVLADLRCLRNLKTFEIKTSKVIYIKVAQNREKLACYLVENPKFKKIQGLVNFKRTLTIPYYAVPCGWVSSKAKAVALLAAS